MIEKNFDFGLLVKGEGERKRWCRSCAVPHLEGTAHGAPGTSLIAPQPPPQINTVNPFRKAIWDMVVDDMIARHREGVKKYGVPLTAFNGRDALIDAYQEALDMAVYLRQMIEERTHEKAEKNTGLKSPGLGRTKRARPVPGIHSKPRKQFSRGRRRKSSHGVPKR
jgi:hypothetical protein